MRLTSPVGLAVRIFVAAGVTAIVFVGTIFVVAAYAATFLIVVVDTSDERFVYQALGVGAVLTGPCFLWVVVRTIRSERRQLLADTEPIRTSEFDVDGATIESRVTRLATQFDIATPTVRIHPTREPLAYTTYRPTDPIATVSQRGSPVVVVSTGLIGTLRDAELDAVLAHECAHLANDDLQLLSWLLVPLFAADYLHDEGERSDLVGGLLRLLATVGVGTFTRGRELAADRAAAVTTGSPGDLASALERLDESTARPERDLRDPGATTNAINVSPLLPERQRSGLQATHPSTETRIEQLRRLATA